MNARYWTHAGLIGALCAWGAVPGEVRAAEDEAALQQVVDLNKKALQLYARKDFNGAKETLLEAVVQGKEAGLGTHKMLARTYVHLGAVYVEGLKDRARGVRYFELALKIRPDIQLTPALTTPALEQAFAEAAGAKSAPVPKAPPPPPPPPPAPKPVAPPAPAKTVAPAPEPVAAAPAPPPPKRKAAPKDEGPEEPDLPATFPRPLNCPNPDEAPPGENVALRCVLRPGVTAARVLLFYRSPGAEDFKTAPTKRSRKGWYNAVIPAADVVGKSLQYYFEARDSSDKAVENNGRADSPNLLLLREGAPSTNSATALLRLSQGDQATSTESDDPLAAVVSEQEREQRASVPRRGPGSIWIALTVGSGYGWHPRRTLEFRDQLSVAAGPSPSRLINLNPEVGYQLTDSVAVSLTSRHQFIPEEGTGDATAGSPKRQAHAVLLRGHKYLGDGSLQAALHAAVGGGQGFRLYVPPRPGTTVNLARNDTVRGGPFLVGAGGGLVYHLARAFALTVELRGLAGFPDFAVNADLVAGGQVAF
jgi:hypothetical protein